MSQDNQHQLLQLSEDDSQYCKRGAESRSGFISENLHLCQGDNSFLKKNLQKDDETIEFETYSSVQVNINELANEFNTFGDDQNEKLQNDQNDHQNKEENQSNFLQVLNLDNRLSEEQIGDQKRTINQAESFIQINPELSNTQRSKVSKFKIQIFEEDTKEKSLEISKDLICFQCNKQKQSIKSQKETDNLSCQCPDSKSQSKFLSNTVMNHKSSALNSTYVKGEKGAPYWKFLGIMKKVKKYVHILSDFRYYRDYKNLSSINLNAINDSTYFLQEDINFSMKNILKSVEVIEPNSWKALTWNLILLFVLFLLNIFIPLKVSMNITFDEGTSLYLLFYVFPCITLIVDILLNFNIAYYEKGILVIDHQKIINNYFKLDFMINIITTMALILSTNIELIEWILMIRLLQIPSLISKIDEHFQLQQKFNTLFELTKLLLLVFYCAHLVGCGFHYVAQLEIKFNISGTWLENYNIQQESVGIRYLYSIYFAIITMVTVGYGDITPQTPIEKIYTIIVTIFSCGMFGYSMNTIGAIFQDIAKKEATFKQIKYDMTQYMSGRGISNNLQIKVLKNLEHSNALQGNQVKMGEQIMESLTTTLRNQIKKEFYGSILSAYKLFNLNFSQEARNEICLHMKEIIVQPGETIFEQGGIHDKIYFLYKGQMDIIILNQNQQCVVAGRAQQGSMLGQNGFFSSFPESFGARSFDTSYLLYCDRNNFLTALQKYKKDYEVFFKLRDNMIIFQREWDTSCYSCNKLGHKTNNCSFYNLNLVKLIVISRFNIPIVQERDNTVIRKSKRTLQTLSQRQTVMKKARKIRLRCFYEAYDGNYVDLNDDDLELNQNDMEFMIYMPIIRYENAVLVYSEREVSDFSDDEYIREQIEHNMYNPNISYSKLGVKNRKNIFECTKQQLSDIQRMYQEMLQLNPAIDNANKSDSDSEEKEEDQNSLQIDSNEQNTNMSNSSLKISKKLSHSNLRNQELAEENSKDETFKRELANLQDLGSSFSNNNASNINNYSNQELKIKSKLNSSQRTKDVIGSGQQILPKQRNSQGFELSETASPQKLLQSISNLNSLRKLSFQSNRINPISESNIIGADEQSMINGISNFYNQIQNINASLPSMRSRKLNVVSEVGENEEDFTSRKQSSLSLKLQSPNQRQSQINSRLSQSKNNQSVFFNQMLLPFTSKENTFQQPLIYSSIKDLNQQNMSNQSRESKLMRVNSINKQFRLSSCDQSSKTLFSLNKLQTTKEQMSNSKLPCYNGSFQNDINFSELQFMINDMDAQKEFSGYYPHNNISHIMKQCKDNYNKIIRKKIKIHRTKRNLSYKRKATIMVSNSQI